MNSTPDIRKAVKEELKKLGFLKPSQDGSALFLYQELESNRICLQFTIKEFIVGKKISFKASYISNQIGDAINYITQEKHTAWPGGKLNSKTWDWVEIENHDISKMTLSIGSEAIDFVNESSFEPMLEDILSTINRRGSHQLWHIAGLASIGDQDSLIVLSRVLLQKNRGGLAPYIEKQLISRALDYVVSNA